MLRKERIFLDSSIIIGLFSGDDDAEKILGGIINQSLCINEVVFSEVVYKSMVLKFLENEEKYSMKKLKRKIDSYVYLYGQFSEFTDEFEIDFLIITKEVVEIASSLASKYNLLPNDALIAATCKHHGINKIATFDPDFDRVEFLAVVTPE
ncbi:MAG: PIN domain-containing protein [Methanophagales archaeon]|nr:PIN domain-containing protein [Methanophagales archaeon]